MRITDTSYELWDGRHWLIWGHIDGLPAFAYRHAPDGLATRAQLNRNGRRRARGQEPYAVLCWNSARFGFRTANLYRLDQTLPSRRMSPRWRAAITQMYLAHCTCRCCGTETDGYLPTSVWTCLDCRTAA